MSDRAGRRPGWWLWALPTGAIGLVAAAIFGPAYIPNLLARWQGCDVVRDIPYADGERRSLDVYRPSDGRSAPVLVFFYGGSWQMGSKDIYVFLATALASHGYVVVAPDYRVYPEVKFPAFLQGGAQPSAACSTTRRFMAGIPARIVVMVFGGAYIAAMLALDPEWLGAVGLDRSATSPA